MRSAGFEPAIPSLGSSYLNRAGLTSLGIVMGIVTKVSLYILSVPEIFDRHKKSYSKNNRPLFMIIKLPLFASSNDPRIE
jgi:hypothetical protein